MLLDGGRACGEREMVVAGLVWRSEGVRWMPLLCHVEGRPQKAILQDSQSTDARGGA